MLPDLRTTAHLRTPRISVLSILQLVRAVSGRNVISRTRRHLRLFRLALLDLLPLVLVPPVLEPDLHLGGRQLQALRHLLALRC